MIGLDTGYFVELLKGRPEAAAVWERLVEGEAEAEAAVSALTLFELKRLQLRGAIGGGEDLLEGIQAVCTVVWVDTPQLLDAAARLSHGLCLPAVDALILVSLLSLEARTIYTTDRHLEAYRKKGVTVINLNQQPTTD